LSRLRLLHLRLPEVLRRLEVEHSTTATGGRRGQEAQLLTKELPVKLLLKLGRDLTYILKQTARLLWLALYGLLLWITDSCGHTISLSSYTIGHLR
jgi:hypothetical protein